MKKIVLIILAVCNMNAWAAEEDAALMAANRLLGIIADARTENEKVKAENEKFKAENEKVKAENEKFKAEALTYKVKFEEAALQKVMMERAKAEEEAQKPFNIIKSKVSDAETKIASTITEILAKLKKND